MKEIGFKDYLNSMLEVFCLKRPKYNVALMLMFENNRPLSNASKLVSQENIENQSLSISALSATQPQYSIKHIREIKL